MISLPLSSRRVEEVWRGQLEYLFEEVKELELVTGTRTEYTHIQKHTHADINGIDCCNSITPFLFFFLFFFYKPVSFCEGNLRLLALPGGSSISVIGGCGGLHRVPVNFNHIKLSRPITEGMLALYLPHSAVRL